VVKATNTKRAIKRLTATQPPLKSLVTNLNNAVNNSAANGYAGKTYSAVEI